MQIQFLFFQQVNMMPLEDEMMGKHAPEQKSGYSHESVLLESFYHIDGPLTLMLREASLLIEGISRKSPPLPFTPIF
jgi:hypothetical protein